MNFSVKLTSTQGFDGTTVLPPAAPDDFRRTGKDGIIAINLTTHVGIIDPDFGGTTSGNRNLILSSFFVKFTGAASGTDTLAVIDDQGDLAFNIRDLSGSGSSRYGDRRWLIPLGFRLRVQVGGTGPGTLWLHLWTLDDPLQLGAVTPIVP